MAKAIEHGVRSPKSPAKEQRQEKALAYGVRTVGNDFEKRGNEVNTPPSNANHYAKGAKFDSMNPTFKKHD